MFSTVVQEWVSFELFPTLGATHNKIQNLSHLMTRTLRHLLCGIPVTRNKGGSIPVAKEQSGSNMNRDKLEA